MSRRRRKPATFSFARHDQPGARQAQGVKRRLRRPTKGHTAKRRRTAATVSPRRVRGERHVHDPELELRPTEIEELDRLDEVVVVGPRVGGVTLCAPKVDASRALAVVAELTGKRLPALELQWMPGAWLDLRTLGSRPLVLYCQPGVDQGARGAATQLGADTAESRAFAARSLELTAMGCRVVSVSAQSATHQLEIATREAQPHIMLSDDRLELAEEIGLPTFEHDGVCLYERLTLIARDGRVEKVFYPIADVTAHAAEVVEWLRAGVR